MYDSLTAISPIDGRYRHLTAPLEAMWSEAAFFRYRLHVEVEYLIALAAVPEVNLPILALPDREVLRSIVNGFDRLQARRVKEIERTTNHDVKALEIYLRERIRESGLLQAPALVPYVHFGLTSQDVNNTALPLMLRDTIERVLRRSYQRVVDRLEELAQATAKLPMLARTHGQPASPTTLGKELHVFTERLNNALRLLDGLDYPAKFGGATGNFNAHVAAFPNVDWPAFADRFVGERLGLLRNRTTTQIDHYDGLAALFDALRRLNVILLDLSRDSWLYISFDYFKLEVREGEAGSSAMPHKVNPIDFENAEGNLGLANAVFDHLSNKLPVSRLQRDLSDSTVTRNMGLPLAWTRIALESLVRGLGKLSPNAAALDRDLQANWQVLAEAIQTILRREGRERAYDELKDLTRTGRPLDREILHAWIDAQGFSDDLMIELKTLRPDTYIGTAG
jgi:adenylosuccinate lyase